MNSTLTTFEKNWVLIITWGFVFGFGFGFLCFVSPRAGDGTQGLVCLLSDSPTAELPALPRYLISFPEMGACRTRTERK